MPKVYVPPKIEEIVVTAPRLSMPYILDNLINDQYHSSIGLEPIERVFNTETPNGEETFINDFEAYAAETLAIPSGAYLARELSRLLATTRGITPHALLAILLSQVDRDQWEAVAQNVFNFMARNGILVDMVGLVVTEQRQLDMLDSPQAIAFQPDGTWEYQPEIPPVPINLEEVVVTAERINNGVRWEFVGQPDLGDYVGAPLPAEVTLEEYDSMWGLPEGPEPPSEEDKPLPLYLPPEEWIPDRPDRFDEAKERRHSISPDSLYVDYPSLDVVKANWGRNARMAYAREMARQRAWARQAAMANRGPNAIRQGVLARTAKQELSLTPNAKLRTVLQGKATPVRFQEVSLQNALQRMQNTRFDYAIRLHISVDPVLQTPKVRVEVQVRNVLDRPTRPKRDRKSHHNQAYLKLMMFLNITYGTITEAIDFYRSFADNFYVADRNGQFKPLSSFDKLYQQKLLLGIARGTVPESAWYLDSLGMQMDLIAERAQDQAIGTYTEWEKNAFREVLDNFNLTQLPSTVANQIAQMSGG